MGEVENNGTCLTECPNLDFPKYIMLETIRNCNARCSFCPYGAGQITDTGKMPDALYDKIEGELSERANELTRITMHIFGEPLLDRKLAKRIRHFKDKGVREIAITTNASLLDAETASALLDAGVDIIKMSIVTLDSVKYAKLQVGLDFAAVIRNAVNLFALRDKRNPDTAIYVGTAGYDLLDEGDMAVWKKFWLPFCGPRDVLKIMPEYNYTGDERNYRKIPDAGPCIPLMQTLVIDFNGDVPLCCGDYVGGKSQYILGSARQNSLAEIWMGKKFSGMRELHRSGRRADIPLCRNCCMWSDDLISNIAKA